MKTIYDSLLDKADKIQSAAALEYRLDDGVMR